MWPVDNQPFQQHPENIRNASVQQRHKLLTWKLHQDQETEDCPGAPHSSLTPTIFYCSRTRQSTFTVPCDLLLDGFCIGLSKQIQQRTAEVVCVAVWVAQLVGDSIQEQVPSLNMTTYTCETSCFHHSAGDMFSVQGCQTTWLGIWLLIFHGNPLVPSSRLKHCLE